MLTKRLLVTLTVPVEVACETGIEAAADPDALAKVLGADSWREGRYPFTQEQIAQGLRSEVRGAVCEAVSEYMSRKYGTAEVVKASGDGWVSHTPKCMVEAQKWVKDDLQYVEAFWDERTVTVVPHGGKDNRV